MAKVIVSDIKRCLACKSCEWACALAHSPAAGIEEAVNQSPQPQSRISVLACEAESVPLQCRHCEDAPCIWVCPTTALHRNDPGSPVLIDRQRCIGCRACMMACPFGVIDMAPDGKSVIKCDLCLGADSRAESPACVDSCPTGALRLEDQEAVNRRRRQTAAQRAADAQREAE